MGKNGRYEFTDPVLQMQFQAYLEETNRAVEKLTEFLRAGQPGGVQPFGFSDGFEPGLLGGGEFFSRPEPKAKGRRKR